ncbi:Major sperm protein isoform beta [Dirofilaria immitis]
MYPAYVSFTTLNNHHWIDVASIFASMVADTVSQLSQEKWTDVEYPKYTENTVEYFYHSNIFTVLLLLTIIYLLSGNYSLILCNVLCTLLPGILTYFQMASKSGITKKLIVIYWIICGVSFACDTIYASISGYPYLKIMILMSLFHYCTMGNVDRKRIVVDDVLSSQFKRYARKWIANKQSRHKRPFEDMISNAFGYDETTLNSFKTVPKENCIATNLSFIKAYHTTHSTTRSFSSSASRRETEDDRTEAMQQSCTLITNHQLIDCNENLSHSIEGVVSFPNSQVIIRKGHTGPVILSFTNNYKKSVVWALKTNAIRRLAAFPTVGIIPPSETVQIKVDLVEQIPKKISKDRLSLEYFVIDQKDINDSNYYNFFHRSQSTRMKKSLEVVYVQ